MSHLQREPLSERYPVHVIVRCQLPSAVSLRRFAPHTALRRVLFDLKRERNHQIAIIAYSVQSNHLHLIVEGADLRSGLHSLCIRLARRLNRALDHRGRLFADRHQRVVLRSPRQTRFALAYVLLNRRRHLHQAGATLDSGQLDPCSSGAFFDGWTRPGSRRPGASPVSEPRTWLASTGWRRHGLIGRWEIPGVPLRSRGSPS